MKMLTLINNKSDTAGYSIQQLIQQNKLDLFKAIPKWSPEKENYKGVLYWNNLPSIDQSEKEDQSYSYFLRSSQKYVDIDFDLFKHLNFEQAKIVQNLFPQTLAFGRNGIGHYVYEVTNSKNVETRKFQIGSRTLIEFRTKGCYSLLKGKIDNEAVAKISNINIHKINCEDLWQITIKAALITAITVLRPGDEGVIQDYLIPIIGELGSNNFTQEQTEEIICKFLELINREDRTKETIKTIASFYKKKHWSNVFSNSFPLPWSDQEKYGFRNIVKELILKSETKEEVGFQIDYGDDIFNSVLEDPNWIVKDYLPEGLCVLGSRPKVGKSWMGLGLAIAICNGDMFFNQKVNPGKVLYCALEDNRKRIKRRFNSMGLTQEHKKPDFIYSCRKLTQGFEDDLKSFLDKEENKYRLIIIDTLGKIIPGDNKVNKNAYLHDTALLSNIHRIALDRGITILVIHHTTKAKLDDVFDEISGTTAIQGVADTLWVLGTNRQNKVNPTLHVIGRDVEQKSEEIHLNLEFRWELLGNAGNTNNKDKLFKDISDALLHLQGGHNYNGDGFTPNEVIKQMELKNPTTKLTSSNIKNIKTRMNRMRNNGDLIHGNKSGSYRLPLF
jgi:hypothetical protein